MSLFCRLPTCAVANQDDATGAPISGSVLANAWQDGRSGPSFQVEVTPSHSSTARNFCKMAAFSSRVYPSTVYPL